MIFLQQKQMLQILISILLRQRLFYRTNKNEINNVSMNCEWFKSTVKFIVQGKTQPYKVLPQPYKVLTQPYKVMSQPYNILTQPYKVLTQPYKVWTQPFKVWTQLYKVWTQPYKVLSQPYKVLNQTYNSQGHLLICTS